ncbi:PAS domain S-box protein [Noviherbaspirillum album]|nr:PAS domain S-box protein [Noviherbaspirillum sp. CPCC 100848]
MKLLDSEGCIAAMNRNGVCVMEIDDIRMVVGKPWKLFWPESSHAEIDRAMQAAMNGSMGHFSGFCPTAKGTPKWWDVTITPVHGNGGQLESLLAMSRDMTAEHRAIMELRASEERFRSLVKATAAIVWNVPASGQFETGQESWAAFTGQTFEEYRGWGWLDAVHPEDRDKSARTWKLANETGTLYQHEHRLRRADGQYRHMSVRAVPLTDSTGAIREWVGLHTDITEQVLAYAQREHLIKEVQAVNERMIDVLMQAPAFICVLRGPDHVFEMINERYSQLVGHRQLVGQSVRQALPEIEGQGFFEQLDRVYQTGESFTGTDMAVQLRRSPGTPLEQRFIDLVYMALRDGDGTITGILVHGVDQTERKQAEMALYNSRERLQNIVSQAATGVVETDAAGRITFVNQKYCDMLGYEKTDLIGEDVLCITAPSSVPETVDTISRLAAGGAGMIIEKQYSRKDGSLMWATSSVSALRDQQGRFQGIVAIVVDISESKRSNEALRRSEERYRTLFESMDQGFCIIEMMFDPDGVATDYRFIEMNRMFEKHTGLKDAANKTARELVPNLDRFWFDTYGRVAVTGEACRFEHEASAMNRWFDVYATRLGGPDSRKVALLFSDITHRKQTSEELKRYAARQSFQLQLADRLRALSDADEIASAAGELLGKYLGAKRVVYGEIDESGKLLALKRDWNDGKLTPMGNMPLALDGRHPLIPDAVRAGRIMAAEDVVIDEQSSPFAETYLAAGVRSALAMPLMQGGRLKAVLHIHDSDARAWKPEDLALAGDVVDRIRSAVERSYAEAERLRAEEALRETDRRKDEFLAMLAHELRNPLAPISAAAELLKLKELPPERVRHTSEIISRQVDHMTNLVNDLLDVSRVTRGLVKMEMTPLDLRNIVTDAVEQVTPLIQSRRHHLITNISPDVTVVLGDRVRMVQVIANLVNNAAKYTPEGGNILIKTEVRANHVLLEIIDDGIGMEPALVDRVFDLFTQAQVTSDRSSGGLGLGLALVKSLVELHGGSVSCASLGQGKGSRFSISLPRLLETGERQLLQHASQGLHKTAQPLRILIVDDNIDAANILAMLLEAGGHDVFVEHRAKDALRRAKLEKPDVCLLDIGLPEMDGNELARHLRSQPETADSMLVAITGYGQEEDRKTSLAAGFDHHFAKPVDTRRLASVLGKAGGQRVPID